MTREPAASAIPDRARTTPVREARRRPATPPPSFFTVHAGDARRLDLILSAYSSARFPLLTSTITSPPYGAMKDYGDPAQIGYGQRPDEYLVDLRRVFESLYRHTKADGSMWVIADTLRARSDDRLWRMRMLPFELSQEAERVGWILRDVVMWVKDKTLPWSGKGRMRNGFEYLLFFVKSSRFQYHVERLREPSDLAHWWVRYPERYNPQGKAPANVWAVPIPVQGSWANTAIQHACPLPADLVERMILLSTEPGDVVFDPFAGSGVVVAEAKRLERRGAGIELVEAHVDAFHRTVLPEITERRGTDVVQELRERSDALGRVILDLRTVKYPKALMLTVRDIGPDLPRPFAAYVFRRRGRGGRIAAEVVVVLRTADVDRADEYLVALERATRRRPASKFGIEPSLRVTDTGALASLHRGRRLWAYVGGRTHRAEAQCRLADVEGLAATPSRHDIPLVASNVFVDETPRRLTGTGL